MADLQDVVEEGNAEVISALNALTQAVKARPTTGHTLAVWIIYPLIATFIFNVIGGIWDSKAMLSVRYDTPMASIFIEDEPHDCDFMRAPLGVKGCSYPRETNVVKTGVNASGQHVVTYDDEKTWTLLDDPSQVHAGIYISWKKQ